MPLYDYECEKCGLIENVWAKVSEDELLHDCGAVMNRVLSAPNIRPDLQPYVDENMGQTPVHVSSRRHRDALLKERGLAIRN
jgi:putative FmdB family regulatory protein